MSLKENQEVIPTSKSHLKALVKKGREAAMKNAEDKDKPKSWPNRSGQPDFAARMKAKHGANWRTANADAVAAREKAAKDHAKVTYPKDDETPVKPEIVAEKAPEEVKTEPPVKTEVVEPEQVNETDETKELDFADFDFGGEPE